MKKNLFLILMCAFSLVANSQNCFWAKRAGATNSENGGNVATDLNGNIYVIGDFEGSTVTFGTTTLTSSNPGSQQYFLVKYDPSGLIQWAKGATGIATSYGIATDNSGNIYVTGSFDGVSTVFGSTTLTNLGAGDIFVVKYDPNGNLIWAKSAGGSSGSEWGESIDCDGSNSIYLTGEFYSSSITIGSTTLTKHSSSGPDFFIAKYDIATGNAIWAKSAGGNRYDIGYGVTVDGNGSIYVAGTFTSDSIKFGTTATLHPAGPGLNNAFIVKYDSLGNTIWSKLAEGLWGNVVAYDIKSDAANNLFIAGEFQGVNVTFGNDTLLNHSTGSSDVFIAKYDSNGNPIWSRSAGGTNYDYSRKLTVDGIGNVYSVGYYKSDSIFFDGDTLTNSSTNCNTDVVKYDNNGVFLWAKKIGVSGTNTVFGHAIAAGLAENVYFTGTFTGSSSFGSTTITSAGAYDFFVSDIFHFSSGISSFSNVSCFGASDGNAYTIISGGNPPFLYSWTTTPVQTTPDAINLPAGTYNVTITEGYGCAQTSSVTISETLADSAQICMVTVDSMSQHNIIIWDKTPFTTVDSFVVYREITTNNYQPIAVVAFDSLSQFVDTVHYRYFPNSGDPNVGTYRYKIQAKNACGFFSPISSYHNTIYIMNSSGTFTWPQLYTIEGAPNPVIGYVLMRDDSTNGNWHTIGSVAGTQLFITDPQYSTYQSTASWRVQTLWNISCSATRSISTSISNSYHSNLATNIDKELSDNSFSILPNPSAGVFSLQYKSSGIRDIYIEVYNVLGEKIFSESNEFTEQILIDLTAQPKGIYFMKLKIEKQLFTKRIIIQ